MNRINPIRDYLKHSVLAVAMACCLASQAQAQDIVTPIAATAQSNYGPRPPVHAIDGSGMTPSNPVTASSTCATGSGDGTMWLSNAQKSTWITFDLGSVKTLSGFHLWNYNEVNYNNRGVKTAGIYVGPSMPADGSSYASQGAAWGTLAEDFTFTQGPGAAGYLGEDYAFATPVTGRYIQIYVTSGFDGADAYTGISEIRFYGPTTPQADMVSFGPGATIGPVTDNAAAISWTVPFGTNVTALPATFTLSPGATCTVGGTPPVSGETRDFTSPVDYVVKSSDNLITNTYTVTVTVAPDESTLIWNTGSGTWDLTSPNWKGQSSGVSMPFFNGQNVIFESTAGGTVTIASGMEPLTTTVSAPSGTYSFSGGPLAGTGTLTKSGNGNLSINADNTYSGGTIINAGWLTMENQKSGALGTGPVTLNGGTLFAARINTANPLIVTGGRLWADGGWGGTWSGPVTLNGDLTVFVPGYDRVSFTGNISGVGGLIVEGGGSANPTNGVHLDGINNTYTGGTRVTGNSLYCSSSAALGTGALNISSTGKVFLTNTGDQVVASLTLGGVTMPPGTYGSSNSPAPTANQLDTYFPATGGWGGELTFRGTVTVASSSPYDTWAAGYLPANVSNPAADNDGDGQSNQQEFAFGLNPTTGSSVNPITQQLAGGVFKYTRTKDSGLIYKVYYSTDLSAWTLDASATQTPAAAVAEVETVTVTLAAAAPLDGKLFVRVAASPPP